MLRPLSRALQTAASSTSHALRRSWLYVPASEPRMLAKSLVTPADTFIFDLEDSVADAQKADSRTALSAFLSSDGAELSPARVAVRINSLNTPYFKDDLHAALAIPSVTTLVLPKVQSDSDLDAIAQEVGTGKAIDVVVSIESARALWGLHAIASWQPKVTGAGLRVSALLFAAEDYCADARVQRTPTAEELVYPRSRIVVAARTFGLDSIDMVYVDHQNEAGLSQEALSARRLGFDGKQAIHPSQVATIHSVFQPTKQEVDRAVRIIKGMRAANAKKRGAFSLKFGFSGTTEMIDAPMVKQARSTLKAAKAAGMKVSLSDEAIG